MPNRCAGVTTILGFALPAFVEQAKVVTGLKDDDCHLSVFQIEIDVGITFLIVASYSLRIF